jgi:hypothetical protein
MGRWTIMVRQIGGWKELWMKRSETAKFSFIRIIQIHFKQAGMSYAQPQAEAVSLNSWLVFPPFGTLNRM